jgi:hypothetical protein
VYVPLNIDRRRSHETDLSTQQSKTEQKIRVPGKNENPGGAADFKAPPGQGTDQADRFGRKEALLGWNKGLPSVSGGRNG